MGRRVKIPEAAMHSGLSEYALRKGITEGRYPHIRTSGNKGKIIIDLELLDECLEREALRNVNDLVSGGAEIINYGSLRRVKA